MKRTKKIDITTLDSPPGKKEYIITANDFYILTNDPSITAWGWAVLNSKGKVMESGCIRTSPEHKVKRIRKGDDTVRRISEINQALKPIIREYDITYILSELPHGSQNASAATMIGITTAIVQTIGDCFDVAVEWYSEQDCKKTVLGKRAATKQETIDRIKSLYPSHTFSGIKFRDEAVADALAVHYTAMQQSTTLKLFFKR